ncbi:GNAT family N-acetyltransferase [Salinisphaera sp. Q1T1-3]|uniref:GNAT family N-acetyltransferase n=1 Tax=Salinisphaera sp. Q1T1-3 TaxID=2321229 RepID=UPI000E72D488|nr:GNAT family N-acetyltransferase [Salinisphaera sp. Q1T1-3]RJS91991.1 N-acetyltransferase [Salinisphaera sp. Q1T1-3]
MNIIQTTRLTLEPLVESHAPAMFEVLNDPAIYEFENEPPSSIEFLAQRYRGLEGRLSPDRTQHWFNWVIRLNGCGLCGYVQASVFQSGIACIAYELNSKHWRQGIGSEAVEAMLRELRITYSVSLFGAVLKSANFRSIALLGRLSFQRATTIQSTIFDPDPDELVMVRAANELPDGT